MTQEAGRPSATGVLHGSDQVHVGIMSSNSDVASPSHSGIADIDECANNNGGCDHDCINNPGSHICQCDPGYELHVDLKMCLRELKDEICTLGGAHSKKCTYLEYLFSYILW